MLASDEDILARPRIAAVRQGCGDSNGRRDLGIGPASVVGSHLVIDEEGNFLGSVSGGCVEGAVITEAIDVIEDGKSRTLEFGVADETAWRVGLYVRWQDPGLMSRRSTDEARSPFCHEQSPRRAPRHHLDHPIRRAVNSALSWAMLLRATRWPISRSGLALRKSGNVQYQGKVYFLTRADPPVRLIVIGAVHISQAWHRSRKSRGST